MSVGVGVFIALSIVISAFVGFLATLALIYRRRWEKLQHRAEKNLPVDLELATTDQLLHELRGRQRSYVLLMPSDIGNEALCVMKIEAHNLEPVAAWGILKMASILTEQELNRQGFQLPDTPPFGLGNEEAEAGE